MFQRIDYKDLNSRQKENYNFQKVAGELADFGYNCLRLNDDWQGADFIACHIDGNRFLKIQLKGRMTISAKYAGKDIHIAFLDGDDCYVYPHDEIMQAIFDLGKVGSTVAWQKGQSYDWPSLPVWARTMLQRYKV